MALNEQTESILGIAEEIADTLTDWISPINDGDREINAEATTSTMVSQWEDVRNEINKLIDEAEIAWALANDDGEPSEEGEAESE